MHENLDRAENIRLLPNRVFGCMFALVFVVIGLLPMIRSHYPRKWAFIVAGFFLFLALAYPATLNPLKTLWIKITNLINGILLKAALFLSFYLIITPVAIVRRLMGKDPLGLVRKPGTTTFWVKRGPGGPVYGDMTQQF